MTYRGRDDSKLFAPLPSNSVTKLNLALVHRAGLEPLSTPRGSPDLTGPSFGWGLLLSSGPCVPGGRELGRQSVA